VRGKEDRRGIPSRIFVAALRRRRRLSTKNVPRPAGPTVRMPFLRQAAARLQGRRTGPSFEKQHTRLVVTLRSNWQ
jgi:hypothetical protein